MENEEYHYDYGNDNGESKASEDDGNDPYIWEPLDGTIFRRLIKNYCAKLMWTYLTVCFPDITLHLLHKLLVESHHTDDMKLLSHKARYATDQNFYILRTFCSVCCAIFTFPSIQSRTSEKLMESSFVYEELPFNILEEVFEKVSPKDGGGNPVAFFSFLEYR